jgi:flagellar biosynthetic protein FliR
MTNLGGLPLDQNTLVAFLLVLARTSAWSVSSPIIGIKQIPGFARLALAVPLALFVTPTAIHEAVPTDLTGFAVSAVIQIGVGLALGFLTGVLLTAVEMAGGLADLESGFSYGSVIDPITGSDGATFARLANLLLIAILFAGSGASTIIGGFLDSFRTLPLGGVPHLAQDGAGGLGHLLAGATLSSVEIAAPLLGAIFLTDIALGLFSRLVPQANILSVGLSLKAFVAFAALGTVLLLLPGEISGLLEPAIHAAPTVIT